MLSDRMRRRWIAIGFSALLLLGCAEELQPNERRIRLANPEGSSVTLIVELARTPQERERGLMGRTKLGKRRGMLFVFGGLESLSFWMKDTLIPLDILYFDHNGTFISGATMQPCAADPCPSYPSEDPAQFALEVSAGFIEQQGVEAEWRLEFLP